ncbi:MAG TPA: sugar phosphate isomerase/epimerase family protein, partial [Clostridia bacterium]|nr:sugar phosphate isomerase/epimerase family protein [Clostridia bacterium]
MNIAERKYSIITCFMGAVKDRFIDYQPVRSMLEMVKMASQVKRCKGLELVYPQNFQHASEVKDMLSDYGLRVSTVNLNVKSDPAWRFGSFTHTDPATRQLAISQMKRSMDSAAELACDTVTCAMLGDGADYSFEIHYEDAYKHALDGIREAAAHLPEIRISIEYKLSEPRVHCLLNNAGKTACFAQLTGCDNVGVTLDFGHALQSKEVPADSVAFLSMMRKLFYVHINDNDRNWDWDMVPGMINLWDYIEFALALKTARYDGWITADVFPQRHDPILIMEKTFAWMDDIFDIAEKVDQRK